MSAKKNTGVIIAEDIKDGAIKSAKGIGKIVQEFKDFALRGNMIDMAVGIVIGAAFSTMVKSIIDNTFMPAVVFFLGKEEYGTLSWHGIKYGQTISDIINFFILAFVVFIVIKTMNIISNIRDTSGAEEEEEEKEAVQLEIEVLEEIRDLLKEQTSNRS